MNIVFPNSGKNVRVQAIVIKLKILPPFWDGNTFLKTFSLTKYRNKYINEKIVNCLGRMLRRIECHSFLQLPLQKNSLKMRHKFQ